MWYETQKKVKKICERNRTSKLEGRGILEGFQTSIHLEGCIGGIYSTSDVRAFGATVIIWYGELEPTYSRFHYHAHWQIHFVCFACEADDYSFFITSIFRICCFIWIFLTNTSFLLQATILGHKLRLMEPFVEMHMWNADRRKGCIRSWIIELSIL